MMYDLIAEMHLENAKLNLQPLSFTIISDELPSCKPLYIRVLNDLNTKQHFLIGFTTKTKRFTTFSCHNFTFLLYLLSGFVYPNQFLILNLQYAL